MVRHSSLFCQIVGFFDRNQFARLVSEHDAERNSKGFKCWDHFVSMLFCQIAQAKSLREISGGLASANGKLRHLGMKQSPSKSTLSYANQKRPWEMYRSLFYETLGKCQALVPTRHKFRFKNKLLSLDSSTISLCLRLFPWAKFRRTKGAVKLHLLLDHDGYLPSFVHITTGGTHDVTVARNLNIAPESIVAMDRAYNDYKLFSRWTKGHVHFVTRTKSNAAYRVVETRTVPKNRNIISDEEIEFTDKKSYEKCPHRLRKIVVFDKDNDRYIELLTNHMTFGATTIAAIYKDRWQIELFFKAIKQNLRIKTFVGTSENALMIQIWTALIAMLIIKFLQAKSKFGWSLSNLVAFLRWNLFTHRDLWAWIDQPYDVLPLEPISVQLMLPFT
ncbi:IS4 family transposase [Desulfoluna spongiiphila]|uniref:IS4 family transposase n=1 Tax=Desulfoluna spongiiphila TaxID=419481 RepID=UPI0012578FA9|nr:IS4 family transposase [Desulfoluna spongiiphila]VVS93814.1 transposase is4-like [Desulfoluna spongiiphila]